MHAAWLSGAGLPSDSRARQQSHLRALRPAARESLQIKLPKDCSAEAAVVNGKHLHFLLSAKCTMRTLASSTGAAAQRGSPSQPLGAASRRRLSAGPARSPALCCASPRQLHSRPQSPLPLLTASLAAAASRLLQRCSAVTLEASPAAEASPLLQPATGALASVREAMNAAELLVRPAHGRACTLRRCLPAAGEFLACSFPPPYIVCIDRFCVLHLPARYAGAGQR